MDKRVVGQTGQHIQPTDIERIGKFPQSGIDRLTRDLLIQGGMFRGYITLADGLSAVRVAPGTFYRLGQQFATETERVISLAEDVPVLAGDRRIVLLVVQGQERPAAAESRTFTREIEDGQGGSVKQRVVETTATVMERVGVVSKIAGALATQPISPPVPAEAAPFAEVLLDTSGIVRVSMLTGARAPQLADLSSTVLQQQSIIAIMAQEIAALRQDLSGLDGRLRSSASSRVVSQVIEDVALLKDLSDISDRGAPYGFDRFMDERESHTTHVDYDARVGEGLRFPWANQNRAPIQLFNPNDPRYVHASAGLLCPAYDIVVGSGVGTTGETMPLGGSVTSSLELRELHMTRERLEYGPYFNVCNNNTWWQSGRYDLATGIFAKDGEEFEVADYDREVIAVGDVGHAVIRLRRFWKTTTQEPYQAWVPTDRVIQGVIKAQSWIQGQERWCPGIRLGIVNWGAGASVSVSLVECREDGSPDPTRALATATVAAAGMQPFLAGAAAGTPEAMTPFRFTRPLFLRRRSYAILIATVGEVTVATARGEYFLGGNYFESTDGQFFVGSTAKDLAHAVEYCRFRHTTLDARMLNINLDGGIDNIRLLCGAIVPANTDLAWQVNAGGAWQTMVAPADDEQTVFGNGTTATYDFRAFLTGNEWVMPILDLGQSEVETFRPDVQMRHISHVRTLPSGFVAAGLEVRVVVAEWDPARHALTCRLREGPDGAILTEPDAPPLIRDVANTTRKEFVWTFTGAVTNNNFAVDLVGTTNNARVQYHLEYEVYEAR